MRRWGLVEVLTSQGAQCRNFRKALAPQAFPGVSWNCDSAAPQPRKQEKSRFGPYRADRKAPVTMRCRNTKGVDGGFAMPKTGRKPDKKLEKTAAFCGRFPAGSYVCAGALGRGRTPAQGRTRIRPRRGQPSPRVKKVSGACRSDRVPPLVREIFPNGILGGP